MPIDNKPNNSWEHIGGGAARLRVYRGWLVTDSTLRHEGTSVFVPDPRHEWSGTVDELPRNNHGIN